MNERVSLVTGGNKGIGLELCKQLLANGHYVILTSRNEDKGKSAVASLSSISPNIEYQKIDLEKPELFDALVKTIKKQHGKLDTLINNAGINLENSANSDLEVSALNPNYEDIQKMLLVNTINTIQLTNKLLPILSNSDDGRIINISSSMAQLKNMTKGSIGYRLSKTGMNVMTKVFSEELKTSNIKINSVSPGWVKTDMGSQNARLEVEEAVETIIWLATVEQLTLTGKFLKDKKELEW